MIGFGEAGRVVRVQDRRSRIYGEAEGLPRAAVTALLEDSDRTVWAASSRGLFALHNERFERIGLDTGLPDTPVYGIRIDSRGRLVVGTGAGIFRRVESSALFELLSPAQEGVPRSLTDDGGDALYVTDSIVRVPVGRGCDNPCR